MECNPKGGGGENFGAKQGSLRPRAENLGGDGGLPLARSPDVRTLPKASRQKERAEGPTGPAEPAPPGAQRLPAPAGSSGRSPARTTGLENCRQAQRSPRAVRGVNQRRGLSSSTEEGPRSTVPVGLGGSRHLHGTPGIRRRRHEPAQAASIAAGVARWRTAARHTHAWNGRPSSSHRTHTASGVEDTATASTRDWVPSFAGTHARTGRRPLPSIGAPIASGESEYRASSGAVYLSRRR